VVRLYRTERMPTRVDTRRSYEVWLRRHRSWLDSVGTGIAVQQRLMRHADVRTTMNVYGDVVTDEMQQAQKKIANLALNGLQNGLQ